MEQEVEMFDDLDLAKSTKKTGSIWRRKGTSWPASFQVSGIKYDGKNQSKFTHPPASAK